MLAPPFPARPSPERLPGAPGLPAPSYPSAGPPACSTRIRSRAAVPARAVPGGDSDVNDDRQVDPQYDPRTAEPPGVSEDPLGRLAGGIPRHRPQAPRGDA